jgi:hypothetical protein
MAELVQEIISLISNLFKKRQCKFFKMVFTSNCLEKSCSRIKSYLNELR